MLKPCCDLFYECKAKRSTVQFSSVFYSKRLKQSLPSRSVTKIHVLKCYLGVILNTATTRIKNAGFEWLPEQGNCTYFRGMR